METAPHPRCCPTCSARLLPEETVCSKCVNNARLPPRRPCAWCGEWLSRGMVICRHCHADLAVPVAEPVPCEVCGAAMSATALACVRCGTRVSLPNRPTDSGQRAPTSTPEHVGATVAPLPHTERSRLLPRESSTAGGVSERRVGVDSSHRARFATISVAACAAEAAAIAWAVSSGRMPWPEDWLDLRVTAWIVLHAGCFLAVAILASLVALVVTPAARRAVWSPPALAAAAVAPSLYLPWLLACLVEGIAVRSDPPARRDETSRTALLRTVPAPASRRWTGWMLVQLAVALLASAALVWPEAWRGAVSPRWLSVIDAVQSAGPVLRWGLAGLGVCYVAAAAGGAYWESYRDGGLVAWLTPVVLLAPLLVYLSTSLLTGLGRDVAGPQGISADTALRDSLLLWGLLSVYGGWYTVSAWAAMQRHVTAATLGYALLAPLALAGWETIRRETHRNESVQRLAALAAGLRQYAEVYRELPPPSLSDAAGRPLLSWRVLVLPYIGAADLYGEFRLDEPWDSPDNRGLLARRPDLFRNDETPWHEEASTRTAVVVGPETLFPAQGGVAVTEFTRPEDDAVALLERTDGGGLPWTAPRDVAWDELSAELQPEFDSRPPLAVTIRGELDDLRPPPAAVGEAADVTRRFLRANARR